MKPVVRIKLPGGAVNAQVAFRFDRQLVDLIRSFAGARWSHAGQHWRVPARCVPGLIAALERHGYPVIDTRLGVVLDPETGADADLLGQLAAGRELARAAS